MDKFIVTVVPDEAAAYAFLSSLESLDGYGSIELYATEVVTKTADGQLVRKQSLKPTGLSTIVGSAVGAMLGLLAGPVGVAVGAVAGGASGFASQHAYSGVSGELIANVSRSLVPGAYAVFAEAYEDWTFPVDDAAQAVGGRVFRQSVGETVKAQMKADDDAGREEMARLDAEIASAEGDAKAKLEAKREEARARNTERTAQLRRKWKEIQASWDAKIASVKQKADKASSDAKRRHEANAQKLSTFVKREKAALERIFSPPTQQP